MASADSEFRDFVAGFAEPLTRLAGLLIAVDTTTLETTHRPVIRALARTKRDWRDGSSAPEAYSVGALISRLPRVRSSAEPSQVVDFPDDEPEARAVKAAVWRAWCSLDPSQRVPLVFADPSIASRRLAGIDLPSSSLSGSKVNRLRADAAERIRSALAQDPVVAGRVDDVIDNWLAATLAEVAARFHAPADIWSQVDAEVNHLRWKAGAAAVAVVAVLVGGWTAAAGVSQPKQHPATASDSAVARPPADQPLTLSTDQVVDWPTRGNLSDDSELIAQLRSAFVAAHPDALGQVRVLLAADTTWFRLAYATSQSPDGAIGAWFYGPVGADALTEGASRHGVEMSQYGAVAAAVSDPSGHTVLVVIGPPDTTEVQWADVESLSAPDPPQGVDDLAHPSGVTIHDVSSTYVPAVRLVVSAPHGKPWSGAVPEVQLVDKSAAQIPVERGASDPKVMAAAMDVARDWERTGAFGSSADPTVVWGGVDDVGDLGVVVRMASPLLSDLVVVTWLDDHQSSPQSRAYRLDATSPDTPLAFFYTARDGARVGLVAPNGVAKAALTVDGVVARLVSVDSTGFASMPVQRQTGLLAEQSIQVQLFAASGQPVGAPVEPIQPLVGGDA
jgi:hypothetical protein